MAFNLNALLSGIAGLPQGGITEPRPGEPGYNPTPSALQGYEDPNTIKVDGLRGQGGLGGILPEPDPINMGNRGVLEEAQDALSKAPQRSGMFGVKGTLRDVLGTLGDAFLTQSRNKTIYAPRREQERMSDAMGGFTQGGDQAIAAIERMAQVDPAAAQELFKQVQEQTAKNQQAQIAQQSAAEKRYQEYSRLFGQYAGSSSPETYERMRPLLQTLKERGGLGSEFIVPDAYDEDALRSYQYGAMPTQQQVSTDLRGRTVDQGDRRIEQGAERITETRRANQAREQISRSKGGSRGSNPTDASMAAPIINKLQSGQSLSTREEEILNRLGYSANRGQGRRGSGRAVAPPPSGAPQGGKMVLRNGKFVPAE